MYRPLCGARPNYSLYTYTAVFCPNACGVLIAQWLEHSPYTSSPTRCISGKEHVHCHPMMFLQHLYGFCFTSGTPNKDQQVEQLLFICIS